MSFLRGRFGVVPIPAPLFIAASSQHAHLQRTYLSLPAASSAIFESIAIYSAAFHAKFRTSRMKRGEEGEEGAISSSFNSAVQQFRYT